MLVLHGTSLQLNRCFARTPASIAGKISELGTYIASKARFRILNLMQAAVRLTKAKSHSRSLIATKNLRSSLRRASGNLYSMISRHADLLSMLGELSIATTPNPSGTRLRISCVLRNPPATTYSYGECHSNMSILTGRSFSTLLFTFLPYDSGTPRISANRACQDEYCTENQARYRKTVAYNQPRIRICDLDAAFWNRRESHGRVEVH